MGISGIASVRAKQLSLLVTLGLGLTAGVVRCFEEAANSPASGPEYAKMAAAVETTLTSWLPAPVLQPQEELSGVESCVVLNVGSQFSFGYAFPMAVMLIEETIGRHNFAAHAMAANICLRPCTPILVAFYTASALFESALGFSAVVAALRLLHAFNITF